MPDRPPELARCHDHGLVLMEGDNGHLTHCLACEFPDAVEARLDDDGGRAPLKEGEFRRRVTWETACDLIPPLDGYLFDNDDADGPFVTHKAWEGTLPAGYTEQERFVAIIGYEWGARLKYFVQEANAAETVETLRNEGYGVNDAT